VLSAERKGCDAMGYLRRANQIASWPLRPSASIALRYGLALVSLAVALGLAQTFLHFHLPQPFTAFALSAIAITFWYGGIGPGILAAVLASILRTYFFEAEANAVSRLLYDLVFLLFALLMSQGTRLRNELEARVAERTADLTRANEELKLEIAERKQAEAELRESITQQKRAEEALRQAQADLAHVNRVTTMGELTASLAHEVNQPIAAAGTDAKTCLRWLARDHPDLEEAREAASRVVKDATRAAEIVSRIRLLFKKDTSQRQLVDINEIIREMIVLLRGEATRYSISFRTELATDLPQVMADRVQLQQLLMNLMINGIDAMKEVDGMRQLIINSRRSENEHLLISVSDTGVGLPPQQADQIFNAFVTTKPNGTGMGLSISRSIVQAHGGRLWAGDNSPRGASFNFTLPTKVEAHE
jgi:C4-dicarboxylate-specific signal transduction histidine kinase